MKGRVRTVLALVFGAALALSISAALALAIVFILDWFIRLARKEVTLSQPQSAISLSLIAYGLWAAIITALKGSVGFSHVLSFESTFVLFAIVAYSGSAGDIIQVTKGFCGAAVLAGALSIVQSHSGVVFADMIVTHEYSWTETLPHSVLRYIRSANTRSTGTRSHPLTFAESMMPAFFMLLGMAVKFRSEKLKTWVPCLIGFLLVAIGVWLAQGRAIWLGVFAGLVVMFVAAPQGFSRRLIFSVFFLLLIFASAFPSVRSRLMSSFSSSSGTASDQGSKNTRFDLWRQSIQSIRSHPLTGVGLKSVRFHSINPVTQKDQYWSETHNMFLQSATDLGLIGLGLFLWMLISCFRFIYCSTSSWRAVWLAIFVAFMVAGLTESWMGDKEIALIFWMFMGCVVAAERLNGGNKNSHAR